MDLTTWLLCLSIFIITFLYLLTRERPKTPTPLPPGPHPLPLFGNLLSLRKLPHRALANLSKEYGPVMTIRLGLTTIIAVSSPEFAKEALQKKDHLLSDRWIPDAAKVPEHLKFSMVLLPPNNSWKQLRSLCATHLVSHRNLEASKHLRLRKVRDMISYIRKLGGQPVHIGHAVFGLLVSVVFSMLCSFEAEDVGAESLGKIRNLVSTLTEVVGKPNVSDFYPFLRSFDLQGRRRCMAIQFKELYSIFDQIIDRRLRSKSSRSIGVGDSDFLDLLLQLVDESKLERKAVNTFLADMFVAGTDTTSITIEWAMAELLRSPNALEKARAELEEVIGSSKDEIEESDIQNLPYLQAVVKEVLRLHPAGSLLLPHKAMEDVELGGYIVPKGTPVLVNAWAIGRDEKFWSEPNLFKPERFMGKEVDFRGRDFEIIPFGSGRRSCPGMPLAARMLPLTLASLLHACEWTLPQGMEPENIDLEENFGATITMRVPFKAIAFPIIRNP